MGRRAHRPKGFRDVDGILLLDKPVGLSSNQALQKVRYLFKANKAGHTGSLDPLASGMLPVCFGEATKFSSYLLDARKSYRAVCKLGQTSSTGDAEGDITSVQDVKVGHSKIESVLSEFIGQVEQVPPMHSAIKINGQRLYNLARKGASVDRPARSITIDALELIHLDNDVLTIDVRCSKGTYIRTLAEDIGKELGCGAYLLALQRTGVHPFWGRKCMQFEELQALAEVSVESLDSCLLPVQAGLCDFPEITLDDSMAEAVRQGRAVQVASSQHNGPVNLLHEKGHFLGIGVAAADGRISPKRLMNTAR